MKRHDLHWKRFAAQWLTATAASGAVVGGLIILDTPTTDAPLPAPAAARAAFVTPLVIAKAPQAAAATAHDAPVARAAKAAVTVTRAERARLASEMARWKTRHPEKLVDVIADLSATTPLPVPPTYLLSIAWAETRGKVLAVSPAGAAGLAQATPAAYRLEGLDGKLFVTTDYLTGTRAFIMKKPLGDALAIVAPLLKRNTPAARARAATLTERAIALHREGMDELEALEPLAPETFRRKIDEGEKYNLATLKELEQIIERGAPRADLARFEKRVRRDYTYLRNLQRNGWARYARDLTNRRDALLRRKFGQKPATVIATRPYEAGEYLGRELDARFSPTKMASFLAAHLETKQAQARDLGVPEEKLDTWTAALYNGGAVNVKRMQAGLIDRIRETEKYMKAIPARMELLERSIS